MTTLDTIAANLSAAGSHTGDILWWSLSDAEVAAAEFKAAWTAAGLDPAVLPEEPSPQRALKEAALETFAGAKGYLFRLVLKKDDGGIIYAVVHEYRHDGSDPAHPQGTVTYHQEARVEVQPLGTFVSDVPDHALVQALATAYHRIRGNYLAREIRRSIIRSVRSWGGVLIRESGGIYWVPAPSAAKVRALAEVVGKVGGSHVALLPVHGTPEGNATLAVAARGSIEADLKELSEEIERWKKDGARVGVLERRLEEFQALRDRAAMYRDILSMKVDDLNAGLDALTVAAQTMLDAAAKAPAPEPEAPVAPAGA